MKNIGIAAFLTIISTASLAAEYTPGYTRADGVIVTGRSAPELTPSLLDPYQFEQPSPAPTKSVAEDADEVTPKPSTGSQQPSATDTEYLSRRTANSLRAKDGSYSRSLERYYYRH